MQSEKRSCKNCSNQFVIDPDDFSFYQKIRVPPPTLCPACRSQRRMAWRNDYRFYPRSCDYCKSDTLSLYSEDKPVTIYCPKCWWSDAWDAKDYGQKFDPSQSFFSQYRKLLDRVPTLAILNDNDIASTNCLYTNYFALGKDCYLVINSWKLENCMYSSFMVDAKDTIDSTVLLENCRDIYSSIFVDNSYKCKYTYRSSGLSDCTLCFDCRNSSNCFMSYGLRGKSYCFKNQQYSKEEYQKILDSYETNTYSGMLRARREFDEFMLQFPHKYANLRNCVNTTGEYLMNSKNARDSFIGVRFEDSRFVERGDTIKDSYDCLSGGEHELVYESSNADNSRNTYFTSYCHKCVDVAYSDSCQSCENVFGCVGLKKAQYCIFNVQYSKEEYFALKADIIKQMEQSGEWGEYFPIALSSFGYNETIAQDEHPLTKEEALRQGYKWQDVLVVTRGKETLKDIPDRIEDVPDSIAKEILACATCGRNYRLLQEELALYKRNRIPVPRECFFCRLDDLQKRKGFMKLFHRQCQCNDKASKLPTYTNTADHFHKDGPCPNEFETSYAPDRKELIYCEQCYQAEVA
jgi:hypothetical protein